MGAGSGAFTLALRDLVGADAEVYAVDKDRGSLDELERAHRSRFGSNDRLHVLRADFTTVLPKLPALDGALMANSLHFFRDHAAILRRVRALLKPGGRLLIVEYNVDRGNIWVPHPLSFHSYESLASKAGFSAPRLLATHPSRFLKEFYSAECTRPA